MVPRRAAAPRLQGRCWHRKSRVDSEGLPHPGLRCQVVLAVEEGVPAGPKARLLLGRSASCRTSAAWRAVVLAEVPSSGADRFRSPGCPRRAHVERRADLVALSVARERGCPPENGSRRPSCWSPSRGRAGSPPLRGRRGPRGRPPALAWLPRFVPPCRTSGQRYEAAPATWSVNPSTPGSRRRSDRVRTPTAPGARARCSVDGEGHVLQRTVRLEMISIRRRAERTPDGCAPSRTRTCDLRIRSPLLCPAELWGPAAAPR